MIENAQVNGKEEQERYFTALLKCLDPDAGKAAAKKNVRVSINSFFDDKPLTLKPDIRAGKIEDYVSPLFYAPNVSWLGQRNGMHPMQVKAIICTRMAFRWSFTARGMC